jgi:glucose/arabinose dehydrogenase
MTTGDGGGGNDPRNNAQNLDSPLGKVLRLWVHAGANAPGGYMTPTEGNIKGLVWAYGMRNPWRCTFDRAQLSTPTMYCGDVGQDHMEEVTRVYAGANHGWKRYEGTRSVARRMRQFATLLRPHYKGLHTQRCMPEVQA